MNWFSKKLARLGGESPDLLAQCSERAHLKASATGASILVPAFIAAFGSSYLVWSRTENLFATLSGGLLWGLIIILIDRVMLTTLQKGRNNPFGIALRVLLAIAASTVFAHPLVLLAFDGALTQRIEADRRAEIKQVEAECDARLNTVTERRTPELLSARLRKEGLEKSRDELSEQLSAIENELATWRQKLDSEINGIRSSGQAGDGKLAEQIRRDYLSPLGLRATDLRQQLKDTRRDNESAERELLGLTRAINEDPEVSAARAQRDALVTQINGQTRNDFLTRFEALADLKKENQHVASAYWTLCLLLILAELTPLMARPRGQNQFRRQSLMAARKTKPINELLSLS